MSALHALFWTFAGAAMLSAVLCITRRNAVASALWLVVTLFAIAALFVLLDAQFLAALQIWVYAGAIMVLFLFVIMLLNLGAHEPSDMRGWWGRLISMVFGVGLVAELWVLTHVPLAASIRLTSGTLDEALAQQGPIQLISLTLFRQFLVPFEITSLLLLAALVGAVVLAKRKL